MNDQVLSILFNLRTSLLLQPFLTHTHTHTHTHNVLPSLSTPSTAEAGLSLEDALVSARRDTSRFHALETLADCDYDEALALHQLLTQPLPVGAVDSPSMYALFSSAASANASFISTGGPARVVVRV